MLAGWDRYHGTHHGNAWLLSLSENDRHMLKRFEYVVDMHPDDPTGHSELDRARTRFRLWVNLVEDVPRKRKFRRTPSKGKYQVVFYDEEDS